MSWQATSWAARQAAGNSGRKCLLLLIANHADPAGVCFPGRIELAREAECRPETISAGLADLEARGLLSRHDRRRVNGSKTTDWIVLAPGAVDRGEMRDADPDAYPPYIVEKAMNRVGMDSSPEESSPEENRQGWVRKTGGPEEASKRPSTAVEGARAPAAVKFGGKPVIAESWDLTVKVLDAYNAAAGCNLRALTSAGDPSEASKRIYSRVRAYPDIGLEKHRDIIDRTLRSQWWGPALPTIGVVYGPKVFEDNITRPARSVSGGGRGGKPNASDLIRKIRAGRESREGTNG